MLALYKAIKINGPDAKGLNAEIAAMARKGFYPLGVATFVPGVKPVLLVAFAYVADPIYSDVQCVTESIVKFLAAWKEATGEDY
jgi:hypothetical protein